MDSGLSGVEEGHYTLGIRNLWKKDGVFWCVARLKENSDEAKCGIELRHVSWIVDHIGGMGGGGDGGGAHTLAEWYSARDREMGLKRVLLLALAMVEWAAEQ